MKKRIIFRADGNAENGLGHLYRIFALIEVFIKDHECILITRENSSLSAIPSGFKVLTIPVLSASEEGKWLFDNFSPDECLLVADGYHFNSEYQRILKAYGYYLVYIDDIISGHYYADVIINHSLAARTADYEAESYSRFALGAGYALLRQGFFTGKRLPPEANKRSEALVCFGGADPNNLSMKASKALTQIDSISVIHVVAGAGFSNQKVDEIKGLSSKLRIHLNLGEAQLVSLMTVCDFAVSSASTILFELCAMRVPVIAGYYVSNQVGLYEGFQRSGAIAGAGDISSFSPEDFLRVLGPFLAESTWEHYTLVQEKLIDGHSPQRLRQVVQKLTYRDAKEEDVLLLFNWSNDPDTRANSYSSAPIELESHKAWFSRKLKDSGTRMFIAEYDGAPAGLVRYEVNNDHAVVGILVAPGCRGKGLSVLFLKDTARLFFSVFKLPVLAFIKKTNSASVKAFQNAGYTFQEERLVQGAPSFVYKLFSI